MLSGLPRSGSQVLSSMLNQHPLVHSTATSPIADLVVQTVQSWPSLSAAVAEPHAHQLNNIVRYMIEGAYCHIPQQVVVDKNRWWPRLGNLLQESFGHPPKILITVRPIEEIVASFVLLIERNNDPNNYVDQELASMGLVVNTKNRCRLLWEKYIQHPYTSARMGYHNSNIDQLVITYDDIVNHSQLTMNKICSWLNLDTCLVDLQNLQSMPENDLAHGGLRGLHHVRPRMQKVSAPPEKIIGRYLCDHYRSMNLEFWQN